MRMFTYLFIFSGMMALVYAGGFTDLPTGDLVSTLLTGGLSGIKDSSFYTQLTLILGLTTIAGGIVATLFGRSPDIAFLKAGFVLFFLGAFIIDILWFYEKLFSYGTWYAIVASLIMFPVIIGFVQSILDWWSGTD